MPRKLLFLVTRKITKSWTPPIFHWTKVRNQPAIRVKERCPL
ncbi:MAG: hypothetical protein AVDCRST_MAG93-7178 [uncultured Chloroflexia bacterium]|uniref:Uncharacterized protein n=1 Tax=uncultured Chloroflexia bacterium TaxID=1672391 RepID=A0A6J4M7X6_9CHLR|nr:MAG: hypothetical protein AVDCRST_MAG93-7178 [uncultured Chloroflexia bacterium]